MQRDAAARDDGRQLMAKLSQVAGRESHNDRDRVKRARAAAAAAAANMQRASDSDCTKKGLDN